MSCRDHLLPDAVWAKSLQTIRAASTHPRQHDAAERSIRKTEGPTTICVDAGAGWQDIAKMIADPFPSVFIGVLTVVLSL